MLTRGPAGAQRVFCHGFKSRSSSRNHQTLLHIGHWRKNKMHVSESQVNSQEEIYLPRRTDYDSYPAWASSSSQSVGNVLMTFVFQVTCVCVPLCRFAKVVSISVSRSILFDLKLSLPFSKIYFTFCGLLSRSRIPACNSLWVLVFPLLDFILRNLAD